MIAAIYARRSKEQDDAEDETKSVNRQVENARVFAAAKGWTVLEEHVYIDDGISGASTLTRLRAKARMLDAITSSKKPPFDVLICQAADRLSRRDGDESFMELKTISKANVQVWFYADGTYFRYGTFEANVSGFLKGEFAAEYRRAVSQKTYEAHRRKAQLGHVTGGRVFGYAIEVDKHIERVPNDDDAAVVRRIFDLYATGAGYTRIARRGDGTVAQGMALDAHADPSPEPVDDPQHGAGVEPPGALAIPPAGPTDEERALPGGPAMREVSAQRRNDRRLYNARIHIVKAAGNERLSHEV